MGTLALNQFARAAQYRDGNDIARGARLTAAMMASGKVYNCQVCYDLGVTESSLSRWRSGGPMSTAMAVGLARQLGVSIDWLITGRADPHSGCAMDDSEPDGAAGIFSTLPPNDQTLILAFGDALLEQQLQAIRDTDDFDIDLECGADRRHAPEAMPALNAA